MCEKNICSIQYSWTLQEKTPLGIWIGGTDQSQEGNWTWTDCSPWNFTRWGVRRYHQQPDNSIHIDGDGEDCLVFHGKSVSNPDNIDWNDAACNLRERQFVCSKPLCIQGDAHPWFFWTVFYSGATSTDHILVVAITSNNVILVGISVLVFSFVSVARKPPLSQLWKRRIIQTTELITMPTGTGVKMWWT